MNDTVMSTEVGLFELIKYFRLAFFILEKGLRELTINKIYGDMFVLYFTVTQLLLFLASSCIPKFLYISNIALTSSSSGMRFGISAKSSTILTAILIFFWLPCCTDLHLHTDLLTDLHLPYKKKIVKDYPSRKRNFIAVFNYYSFYMRQ